MELSVRLAGLDVPWRFADSARFEAWLVSRPWLGDGSILGLRVSGSLQVELLGAALPNAVRAADGGASEVVCRFTTLAVGQRGADLVANVLDINVPGGRERLEVMADALDLQPRVLMVDASFGAGTAALDHVARELDTLREELRKLRRSAALTVLIFHRNLTAPPELESLDLDFGSPSVGPLEARFTGTSWRWSSYMHTRTCWEAGGQIDRAHGWDTLLMTSVVGLGHDESFERALNELARAEWSAVARQDQREVLDLVHLGSAARSKRDDKSVRIEYLTRVRLLWRPLGVGASRPVPWVARALLLEGQALEAHSLLRGALVCSPLLREAIVRCLDLEAQMRAYHRGNLRTDGPSDEDGNAARAFDSFVRGIESFDRQFYPPGCPAVPRDAWAFQEFGGFLRSIDVSRPRFAGLNRLRLLRNSLAHGHFVCWKTLELLDSLERELSV